MRTVNRYNIVIDISTPKSNRTVIIFVLVPDVSPLYNFFVLNSPQPRTYHPIVLPKRTALARSHPYRERNSSIVNESDLSNVRSVSSNSYTQLVVGRNDVEFFSSTYKQITDSYGMHPRHCVQMHVQYFILIRV